MEQILGFIAEYGLAVFVIASCIIVFIGILKLCKVFNKITNADVKKCIYYALDVALAFAGSAIYFAIFKLSFSNYVAFSMTQLGATTTLYAIYEHFGLRKLVRLLLDWLAKCLKNDPMGKVATTLKKLGISEEGIAAISAQITTEEEKAKAEKAAKATPVEVQPTTEVKN